MHKCLIVMLALLFCAGATQSAAQTLAPAERAFFDEHISELVQIQPRRLADPAMPRVFAAPFYEVTITVHEGDSTGTTKFIVARAGSRLVSVRPPSGDADLPDLPKMMNPGFRLTSADDARVLQQALDVAYPIVGSGDKKAEANRRVGNRWIFVRGVFFGKDMGFIFETDANGAIVAVKYSLKLP
jgi:hypothetical protein